MTRTMKTRAAAAIAPSVRCAIYTRKSTDEGLEKEFNTLDAQRESGEAFIRSQQHEGWTCVPDRYDDGGFTGGNMERPALRRLMADIEAGKVDCVVVYKVDRLSRSLLDFARMMETFDAHRVSFVSVTQQFNTTHSMGRLTLNILLSFAQFEREIISERTRDKIAAARRKGKWSGGMPLLGYDVDPRGSKLVVAEDEAGSRTRDFRALSRPPIAARDRSRTRPSRLGEQTLDDPQRSRARRPSVHKDQLAPPLLTNVAYVGKVRYKTEIHEGEHAALIDVGLWQRVQTLLSRNGGPVRNLVSAGRNG